MNGEDPERMNTVRDPERKKIGEKEERRRRCPVAKRKHTTGKVGSAPNAAYQKQVNLAIPGGLLCRGNPH